MAQVRFSIGHNKASLEAAQKLPYSVWHAVFHEAGSESGTVDAWVAYGEPVCAAAAERALSSRGGEDAGDTDNGRHPLLTQAARAHRDRLDGKRPTFTIYSESEPLHPMCVIRPFDSGESGQESYSVKDGRGQLLCRVVKGRSPSRLRRGWRIEAENVKGTVVGYRGTWLGWLMFVLLLPLWIPLTLVSVVVGILDSGSWDDLTWEPPKRTRWRSRAGGSLASVVLDFKGSSYRWDATNLDVRLAYAQAVLNQES